MVCLGEISPLHSVVISLEILHLFSVMLENWSLRASACARVKQVFFQVFLFSLSFFFFQLQMHLSCMFANFLSYSYMFFQVLALTCPFILACFLDAFGRCCFHPPPFGWCSFFGVAWCCWCSSFLTGGRSNRNRNLFSRQKTAPFIFTALIVAQAPLFWSVIVPVLFTRRCSRRYFFSFFRHLSRCTFLL